MKKFRRELKVIGERGFDEDVYWINFFIEYSGRRYSCGGAWLRSDMRTVVDFYGSAFFDVREGQALETLKLLKEFGIVKGPLPEGPRPEDCWSAEADEWFDCFNNAVYDAQRWAAGRLRLKF